MPVYTFFKVRYMLIVEYVLAIGFNMGMYVRTTYSKLLMHDAEQKCLQLIVRASVQQSKTRVTRLRTDLYSHVSNIWTQCMLY